MCSPLCYVKLHCYGCRLRRLVCKCLLIDSYVQTTLKKYFENTKYANANKALCHNLHALPRSDTKPQRIYEFLTNAKVSNAFP